MEILSWLSAVYIASMIASYMIYGSEGLLTVTVCLLFLFIVSSLTMLFYNGILLAMVPTLTQVAFAPVLLSYTCLLSVFAVIVFFENI